MKTIYLLTAFCAFLLTSCYENSIVIKVNKDGSGLVHHRQYIRAQTTEEDVKLPTNEELLVIAAEMGPNVKVTSAKKAHNPQGWYGYEVIYSFPDINKLTIKPNSPKTDEEKDDLNNLFLTFEMKQGILKATFNNPDWDKPVNENPLKNQNDGPTIDPYAQSKKQSAEKIRITSALGGQDKMIKVMAEDMRVGIFIQPATPLESSNALHQNGGLITLMNVDMEKFVQNGTPDPKVFEGKTREDFKAILKEMDGLDLDLQEPIIIKFQ